MFYGNVSRIFETFFGVKLSNNSRNDYNRKKPTSKNKKKSQKNELKTVFRINKNMRKLMIMLNLTLMF